MNTPKISIVVPVFNAEKYLHQCLDSVVAQTFTDWECILVDDGSTDSSGAICAEYAEIDSRFRVLHKKNAGVSSARNYGINCSIGDYMMFVDSDDSLPQDALQKLFSPMQNGKYDMVMGNYLKIKADGTSRHSETFLSDKDLNIDDLLRVFFIYSGTLFQGYLWNRLLKSEIIKHNKLSFREDIYYKEDGLFLVDYITCCKNPCRFINSEVYNYSLHISGAMMSAERIYNKKYLTNLDARIAIYDRIQKCNLNPDIATLSKESVKKVVKKILRRRPKRVYDLMYLLIYIMKRLIKSNLLIYVLFTK